MYYKPLALRSWLAGLPHQELIGELFAAIKSPGIFGKTKEYRVDIVGMVCNGEAHKDAVHKMLYNKFPNHGKGYKYISWRAVPDNPKINNYPREGLVENPMPYSGILDE